MSTHTDTSLTSIGQAINKSVDYLFQVQQSHGGWRDYISSSAVATGPAVLALYYADREKYAQFIEEGCAWLRQTQHADGGWGDATVARSNLNATTSTLPALKLADPERSQDAIARGLAFIKAQGGLAAVKNMKITTLSFPCLTFMALAGFEDYTWDQVPRLPVEIILLPQRIWRKVSFSIPVIMTMGLLHSCKKRVSRLSRWLVKLAEPKALAWVRTSMGENGGIQESPLQNAYLYISLNQANTGQDIAERLLEFLLEHRRADGSWTAQRYLEVSVTTYILEALETAGYLDDARLKQTIDWLFWQQFKTVFFETGCPAGAWGWGRPSGWADMDDTAGALTMLHRMGIPASDPRLQMGYTCLESMQNRDGSWSMFLKDNQIQIDKSCPALTARVALALYERDRSFTPTIERALAYLRKIQHPDGSVFTLWFNDYVYGTAFTLDAFATMHLLDDPVAERCKTWLIANQHEDGSWGGNLQAPATAEETAWALSALLAEGVTAPPACLDKAAAWLAAQQRPDGTWQQAVVGIYYPDFWYSDDLMANSFPLRALGRYWQWRTGKPYKAAAMLEVQAQPALPLSAGEEVN